MDNADFTLIVGRVGSAVCWRRRVLRAGPRQALALGSGARIKNKHGSKHTDTRVSQSPSL